MNGEINGTMETSMDAADPLDNLENHKNVISEDSEHASNLCQDNIDAEGGNNIDTESSCDRMIKSELDELADDNGKNDIDRENENIDNNKVIEESKLVSNNFNSNNIAENHSDNSNESCNQSMNNSDSEVVFEKTEQQTINNLDRKTKDSEYEKDKDFKQSSCDMKQELQTNEENSENEVDSEDDSSDEEGMDVEPRAEDTVSINSESDQDADDFSQEENFKNKIDNMILLENQRPPSQNGNSHDSSSEVHEIVTDNEECVVTDKEKVNKNNSDNKVPLRRSSRAIKRKRYTDENGDNESDIEEVSIETPYYKKTKPIVINDTKTLVEMAARQMKSGQTNNQKKEPTVVIIDTNSVGNEKPTVPRKHPGFSSQSNFNAHSLYQSIVARGTTVTPISSKSNTSTQSTSQTPQPSILPSLTDDMFVVEAPSFIVPYVYEKPSVKPFREFVDTLGKELDEQKAKEDKENEQKIKETKETEKSEGLEKDEESAESVDESSESVVATAAVQDPNKTESAPEELDEKKKKKKEKRKRGGEDDDASWDGESSTDSDDEILSDEEDKTIIIKDKADAIEEINDVTELTAEKVCSNKSDNYFDCSLGKFFVNIGLSLVQEFVQSDLLKQQNRKLHREKKQGHNTKSTETSIASLMKNIEFSKENNAPYSFAQLKCEYCSFKTESKLVMAHHLETPHMKNSVYKCNYCTFEIRSPHDILYHMEAEHNVRGKLERAPAYHQCANCPFEDNGKGKLARHLIPCAKKFKPESNLAPPLEWEPPAKIPKISRTRNNMMGSFNRGQMGNHLGRPPAMNVASIMPGVSSPYRPRGRSPMAVPPRAAPVHGAPILRGGVMIRHNAPMSMSSNYPVPNNVKKVHQPSISITPLPRQPQPVLPQPSHNSKTFVICEICDGYIKDLEQLRNHMQWIHKVKIHPKMIYNRPPLNCQKCQFRFFTDQGLERHLLGSHGLVTSSMQEAANKGKDAGRCPVCGRVYQWKLLNHVARDHNLTLKPAHLSYKCTVCTATFGMYKQFENHVYSAHSVVAKRVMDKGKTTAPAKSNNDTLLKPLKINDEITIIPQPVKTPAVSKDA